MNQLLVTVVTTCVMFDGFAARAMAEEVCAIRFNGGAEATAAQWNSKVSDSGEGGAEAEAFSIQPMQDGGDGHVMKLAWKPADGILRLSQIKETFLLRAGQEYELKVRLRVPEYSPERGGVFRVFVTDARWTWSSTPVAITSRDLEWTTHTARIRLPEGVAEAQGRIRIEVKGALLEAEIAEITLETIDPAGASVAKKDGSAIAGKEPASRDEDGGNLVKHGRFVEGGGGAITGWRFHPPETKNVVAVSGVDGERTLEFAPGLAVVGVHSDRFPVEPGTAYSLILSLKQDEIPIGFGMGGKIAIRWYRGASDKPQAQEIDTIDGSFDWERMVYSVVSPPDAKWAHLTLTKNGSPGRVFIRNVVVSKGVKERLKAELSESDFIKAHEAFVYLGRRLDYFLIDKGPIASMEGEKVTLLKALHSSQGNVTRDAASAGKVLGGQERENSLWIEMLKGNLGFQVPPDSPYYKEWSALQAKIVAFQEKLVVALASGNSKRLAGEMRAVFGCYDGYSIGLTSTMLKVGKETPFSGSVAREVELKLARQEEESAQVTISALARDLDDISVEVSPLTGEMGAVGPKVTVSRIDYVKTNPPQYNTPRVGWWPDIVFPKNKVDRVAAGSNHSFWITAEADGATTPGLYTGTLSVKQGGKLLQTLELRTKVWDITIPRPGRFKVVGRFVPEQLRKFYGWKEMDEAVLGNWNRYIFKKRWNTTDPFSKALTPKGAALSAALEQGVNSVNLLNASQFLTRDLESRTYSWPTPEQEKNIVGALKGAAGELQEKDKKGRADLYVFGFDEQHDRSQYPLMRHVFELVKKTVPEAKIATTTTYPPLDELVEKVDTWVNLLGGDNEDLAKRRAAGDEMFFYIYGHPFHPFPNASLIDYPGIDGRISFWMAAKMGYSGFLHWLMNGWDPNFEAAERWPEKEWLPYGRKHFVQRNGEGYFLYPGPNGEPVSSVRFELIRDGIEDWELITMLKEALEGARATALNERKEGSATGASDAIARAEAALNNATALVPRLDLYSLDMGKLMDVREEIAEALISLNKLAPDKLASQL